MKRIFVSILIVFLGTIINACANTTFTRIPDSPTLEREAPIQPTQTPEPVPIPSSPLLPFDDKPLLNFPDLDLNEYPEYHKQSIGYTFPDGTISIIVAPILKRPFPVEMPTGEILEEVALIWINPNSNTTNIPPGLYNFLFDLSSFKGSVMETDQKPQNINGILTDFRDFFMVEFIPIHQIINPNRDGNIAYVEFDLDKPLTVNSAVITADDICFIIDINLSPDNPSYYRFCSVENSDLSTRKNFPSEYESLQGDIGNIAKDFELENYIEYNQIISEMEDIGHIRECSAAFANGEAQESLEEKCGSDITVAPVTKSYFENQFDSKANKEDPFYITVGVVKVYKSIDIGNDIIQPGSYQIDYWFDGNNEFYAATISGWTGEGIKVINQQIPAVPATFINPEEDEKEETSAQISACRIFSRCVFFQKLCP